MTDPTPSRAELLARLTDTFRRLGYEGASIADIAADSGLGKSSLYHHFPGGKEEMARAVLQEAAVMLTRDILDPLAAPGPPDKRLAAMLQGVDRFYEQGRKACLIACLTVGDPRRTFQATLQTLLSVWIQALTQLLLDAGFSKREARDRAEDAIARIEGALILAAGLDDPAPFQRTLARIKATLLVP